MVNRFKKILSIALLTCLVYTSAIANAEGEVHDLQYAKSNYQLPQANTFIEYVLTDTIRGDSSGEITINQGTNFAFVQLSEYTSVIWDYDIEALNGASLGLTQQYTAKLIQGSQAKLNCLVHTFTATKAGTVTVKWTATATEKVASYTLKVNINQAAQQNPPQPTNPTNPGTNPGTDTTNPGAGDENITDDRRVTGDGSTLGGNPVAGTDDVTGGGNGTALASGNGNASNKAITDNQGFFQTYFFEFSFNLSDGLDALKKIIESIFSLVKQLLGTASYT